MTSYLRETLANVPPVGIVVVIIKIGTGIATAFPTIFPPCSGGNPVQELSVTVRCVDLPYLRFVTISDHRECVQEGVVQVESS